MVEWKEMGTLSEIGTGSNNREDCSENGMYPFYVRSKGILRIDKYLYDEEAILIPGEGGVGEIFHYINGKYGLHQRTYRVHPTSKDVIGRYLYYYLYENFGNYINQKSYKSTATSIRKPMLLNFPVAVIPISEQNRIVGILDTFTSSIENLKEQIAQRRKQYEYYRDQLLDLEGKEGVEMMTLGEVCSKITDGSHFSPKSVEQGYYMPSVKDMTNSGFDFTDCKQISKEDYEDLINTGCKPKVDDVLIAKDGSMLKYVFPVIEEKEIVVLSSIAILTPRTDLIRSAYLSHYLKREKIKEKSIREFSSKGGVPRIILKNFKKICICVPSQVEQSRIVSVLDTFEASIQNLEAQLAQREKQYEYYRYKLLTFE